MSDFEKQLSERCSRLRAERDAAREELAIAKKTLELFSRAWQSGCHFTVFLC